jgi:hypothetical protein
MCCDPGGRAGKRHADRNTGKIVIPSTIRSQASAPCWPWQPRLLIDHLPPGTPGDPGLAGPGSQVWRVWRERTLLLYVARGEREGRTLEDKRVLVSHMRNGKFVETWQHSEDQCAADEFLS